MTKCLESVVNQDYSNLEIIIVDDGSLDMSPNICDQFAQRDNRINVIHQNNMGVSVARNEGFRRSHGEYVYFMDADDYAESRLISKCVETLEKSGCESVVFNFVRENEDGRVLANSSHKIKTYYTKTDEDRAYFIENVLMNYQEFGWTPWQRFYKRSFLHDHDINFPANISRSEDFNHYLKVSTFQNSVVCIGDNLYHYVIRSDSAIRTEPPSERIGTRIRCCKEYEDFLNQRNLFLNNRREINRCLAKYIVMSISNQANDLRVTLRNLVSELGETEKDVFIRWLRNTLHHPLQIGRVGAIALYVVIYRTMQGHDPEKSLFLKCLMARKSQR